MVRQRKKERFKAVTANPFLAVMSKNMSFRAWKRLYCKYFIPNNYRNKLREKE